MTLNINNINYYNFTYFKTVSNIAFNAPQSLLKNKVFFDEKTAKKEYFSYEQAREYMLKHYPQVKTSTEFFRVVKRANKSKRLPSHPQRHYQHTGEWHASGWRHFLANEHHTLKQFNISLEFNDEYKLTYDCASSFMKVAKVRTEKEYATFRVEHRAESVLPTNPRYYYAKKERRFDIKDFFAPKFLSLEEFKRELKRIPKLETYENWRKYSQTRRPSYVPSNPFDKYGITMEQLKQYQSENSLQS